MAQSNDGLSTSYADDRVIGAGLALVMLAYFLISSLALVALGFNYEESGGSLYEKIHPATFLAIAVLAYSATVRGNALTNLLTAVDTYPGTLLFVGTIGISIAHAILNLGLPFTFFFDTFVAPVVVFFLFKDLSYDRGRSLMWLLHALIIINALVGIFEFVSGERLTPLVASGQIIDDDWRSTALLGHPLANASLTGAYLLMLALGAGRGLPSICVVLSFTVCAISMVTFGGRASSILLLMMLLAIAVLRFAAILRGARFSTQTLFVSLAAIPIIGLAIVGLAEAGVFDQFLERFVDDQGSASARVEMFKLFDHLSWPDLLFLPNPDQMTTLKRIYGIEFGIESFWVSYILTYGLIPALILFAGLFAFCRDLWREAQSGTTWVLVFFFLVASTSVSLSVKTPLFAMLTLMILVLLRAPSRETEVGYATNHAFGQRSDYVSRRRPQMRTYSP